jgi:hypothetical protein
VDYGCDSNVVPDPHADYFVLMPERSARRESLDNLICPLAARVRRGLHSGSQSVPSGAHSILSKQEDL